MSNHTTPDGQPVGEYQVNPPPHPSQHLRGYVPSEVYPHIEALETTGLYDRLTEDEQGLIIKAMQAAYQRGRADAGAEVVDSDYVWVNGIGGLERQPDGSWEISGYDAPPAGSPMAADLAAELGEDYSINQYNDWARSWHARQLGRKGGSSTSAAKSAASRANGRKGGRPRKKQD